MMLSKSSLQNAYPTMSRPIYVSFRESDIKLIYTLGLLMSCAVTS